MMVQIDPRSQVPIWEQIVNQVKELVLKGMLGSGDKIPSVRELAAMSVVNPNTVSKAYKELEAQGIIETLRGRGTFVKDDVQIKFDEKKVKILREKVKQLVVEATYLGVSADTFISWLQEIQEELGGALNDSSQTTK